MRIVTVGTGCCVPSLTRGQACLLAATGTANLAVDLGLGSLTGLLRAGVNHRELDGVLLTHFHPDHVAELAGLLFAANYDPEPRARPLTIVGPEGVHRHLEALAELHGRWVEPGDYPLTVVSLEPGEEYEASGVRVRAGGVAHSGAGLAYRLEAGGRSVAVTGDTGPSAQVAELARGADLLVAECSLAWGEEYEFHMNGVQCGELAAAAGVGALVLTHFYPASEGDSPVARASERFGGRIIEAWDGMELSL